MGWLLDNQLKAMAEGIKKSDPEMLEDFMYLNNGSAIFIKEEAFFTSQGGHVQDWGKNWKPIQAKDIEDARERAKKVEGL